MQLAEAEIRKVQTPVLTGRGGPERITFHVAGICFELWSEGEVGLALDPGLRDFAAGAKPGDIQVRVGWADSLRIPSGRPLFHSGGLWSVFNESKGYRFYFSAPHLGAAPYKAAWFDPEFVQGQVLLFRPYFDDRLPVYPLEYPLDELLMIHRLARGQGVEVHAAGIVDEAGRGHLFVGYSGAGKSTTARLWQSQPGVQVLSDDRIILRVRDGKTWMHGTPWHGDAGVASTGCAPLFRIYFLEHGRDVELVPIAPARVGAELLVRSFVPHHSPAGLEFTLQFLGRLAREVPSFLFRFLPNQTAVEAIRRASA